MNQTLLTRGLQGLYELLHKYSNSFKIYLLAKQFQTLLINSRWRGNFQINYQTNKSLIVINYWSQHYLSRNWKSFIELGIDSHSNLNYRWFKMVSIVLVIKEIMNWIKFSIFKKK